MTFSYVSIFTLTFCFIRKTQILIKIISHMIYFILYPEDKRWTKLMFNSMFLSRLSRFVYHSSLSKLKQKRQFGHGQLEHKSECNNNLLYYSINYLWAPSGGNPHHLPIHYDQVICIKYDVS